MSDNLELIPGGMKKFVPMGAAEVRAILRLRYMQPEWALFFEVANGTGMNKSRSADAVAMNMYTSRGLSIHGFEIKISRSDFLRELKQADKAEAVAQHCDYWWIVAPRYMVKPDELPLTWGLIEVWDDQSAVKKQAKALPTPALSRGFMASLLRSSAKVDESVLLSLVSKRVAEDRKSDLVNYEHRIEREVQMRTAGNFKITAMVEAAKAAGIDLNSYNWNSEKLVKVLKLAETGVLDKWGGIGSIISHLRDALDTLSKVEETLDD